MAPAGVIVVGNDDNLTVREMTREIGTPLTGPTTVARCDETMRNQSINIFLTLDNQDRLAETRGA
jgi:hypothetical protein